MKDFVIVGSGIAGSLMAYHLKSLRADVCLFDEREEAHDGASGNPIANVIPQFTKSNAPLSQDLNACFFEASDFYHSQKAWHDCGALFLFSNQICTKELRNWGLDCCSISVFERSKDILYRGYYLGDFWSVWGLGYVVFI